MIKKCWCIRDGHREQVVLKVLECGCSKKRHSLLSFMQTLHPLTNIYINHSVYLRCMVQKIFLNDFPRLFLAHSRSLGGNNMVVSMILGITGNERAIFL